MATKTPLVVLQQKVKNEMKIYLLITQTLLQWPLKHNWLNFVSRFLSWTPAVASQSVLWNKLFTVQFALIKV